ncbi:ABC transporter permease [Tropicimonas sp. IMCC34011]|uniref:PhnE/PtxC family ABC transporter permease n=1 Tax=Tropicimonas sp. IMCC34011 TaxID=2248759 RepID=UPI001E2EA0FE|nr:ABC transporter permease [Tropicimonas sp. IMCC34011]
MRSEGWPRGRVVTGFAALALLLLPFADLTLAGHDPWEALARMGSGFLRPDFAAIEEIGRAIALTIAFAVAGVAAGAGAGLLMAPFYERGPVRGICVAVRSVHELFWALLLMQVLGLSPMTGVLAIALPYAGIFAKVFSDYLGDVDPRPARALGPGTGAASRFLYATAPLALPQMWTYTLYRFECGMRSSAVLGFIGLPTLGFQLDSFFRLGEYGAASAILICYIGLIATIRIWMRWKIAALWLLACLALLLSLSSPPMGSGALMRFLTEDIVPAPIRDGGPLWPWLSQIIWSEALPGIVATLVVAQIALVLAGLVAALGAPAIVTRVAGRFGRYLGHILLVTLRSVPDYMLAYLFLQVFGPSMLPAILALGLHNGAIIAHLVGRQGEDISAELRPDAPRGLTLWGWDLAPRLFAPYLALCLYRWEIIARDSAVMGLLGVATLGFWIDSAVAEFRLDAAIVLLLASLAMTAGIDIISRRLRRHLGGTTPAISRRMEAGDCAI